MKFKNLTTATRQELGRISGVQHAYEYRHHGRPFRTKAPTFELWFLQGIRKYEAKGVEFELLEPGLMRINWPGRPAVLRTLADIEREYKTLFPSQTAARFEEGAGISHAPVQAVA